MAFVHGKNSYFSIGGVDLTEFLDQIDLNMTTDAAESSTMGNDSKTYVVGQNDATISFSGRYDSTATTGPDDALASIRSAGVPVAFEYGPEGDGSGAVKYSGTCILTAYGVSSPVGDVVSFSGECQVTGDITKGTFSSGG